MTLRPERLLALHRQGLLRSSFHSHESPQKNVEHDYAGKSSISRGRTYTGWIRSLAGCTAFGADAGDVAGEGVAAILAIAGSAAGGPAHIRHNPPRGNRRHPNAKDGGDEEPERDGEEIIAHLRIVPRGNGRAFAKCWEPGRGQCRGFTAGPRRKSGMVFQIGGSLNDI